MLISSSAFNRCIPASVFEICRTLCNEPGLHSTLGRRDADIIAVDPELPGKRRAPD